LIIKRNILQAAGRTLIGGVPEGLDALAIAELAADGGRVVLHVARDDKRLAALAEALRFFAPGAAVLRIPAWDCLPYDRVSPNAEVVGERVDTLTHLIDAGDPSAAGRIVLTTVNAILQRVPPATVFRNAAFRVEAGAALNLGALQGFLARNGYVRTGTVREPGECAVRGGIVDIFPPGSGQPVRLDLFGDEVERIRAFDAVSQRSTGALTTIALEPVSELMLDPASIERFRIGYREAFGAVTDDPLYVAVSEGRKYVGMEHWLPLFHETLDDLFDYVPGAMVTLDHQADELVAGRLEAIREFHDARRTHMAAPQRTRDGGVPYRPLPPDRLYLTADDWARRLDERRVGLFSPFSAPSASGPAVDLGGRRCFDFAAARAAARSEGAATEAAAASVFDTVRGHIVGQQRSGSRVAVVCYSAGSRERLRRLLADHGVRGLVRVDDWSGVQGLAVGEVGLAVIGIEHGFSLPGMVLIGEQDILGERLVRPQRRRRQAEAFIADAGQLVPGDLVVHLDHGIGRYDGLATLTVAGAPHDCLKLVYDGGDRLFVPVENVEVLTRYGSGDSGAALDRLGGAAWQARKARLKQRLKDMAEALIKVAASRALRPARALAPPPGAYEEFCARFPYTETEDQQRAIDEALGDLGSGRPMDRLVCGDVGFGKTEVALRAAFAAVSAGGQVAVVVPTTLLCRQHFATFRERFAGYPMHIEQLSRMVPARRASEIKVELENGRVDIVVGTHALLGKTIKFKNLSLLVVDEEQHFGVAHKERLKQLRSDIHVLTLSATPIPRTLQMALAGVKDMSMIATPPVDRLAVRTFVLPFDPVVVREAIMRERFRGGQVFYVCPRIQDLPEVEARLKELVPEVKVAVAHGRMAAHALEDVMTGFYDGHHDLLLSTQIIESGLDIPTANTLIVHRADMFGLAQLYQLRGRIGRSKLRAYCYLTLPVSGTLTAGAEKRLEVMQSLDSLGAGFTLASHDLDIRGAGNLLGEEQSGHIREVGVELYQHMLEEAVATARGSGQAAEDDGWSPQIGIGMPVLIPDGYVTDLDVRLSLYRRIAALEEPAAIDSFAAEMIDRFGPLPQEVENLLQIVAIKQFCRRAGIDRLDAGPKGATVGFHGDRFADPSGLIQFIQKRAGQVSLRPDHRLVYRQDWAVPARRLKGARDLVHQLAEIAQGAAHGPELKENKAETA
jgi:transcription-repair coupling factor (superfamily II helicase)